VADSGSFVACIAAHAVIAMQPGALSAPDLWLASPFVSQSAQFVTIAQSGMFAIAAAG
jgi:hypothetical protein